MNKIQSRYKFHYAKATKIFNPGFDNISQRISIRHSKRAFDLVIATFIIVFLLSWLIPILAILIRINSRGPIFFIQKRIGFRGKEFNCLKLRTMVVNPEANLQQALQNDPRITTIGKLLRISCLDELPQFLNVFAGDMSIVGPRPHMISDCQEFSKIIKNYDERNSVKPGITGMAQVKGYRGKTDGYYDVFHRFKWDMFYVRNLSFELDMRIIRLTITSTVKNLLSIKTFSSTAPNEVNYPVEAGEYLN